MKLYIVTLFEPHNLSEKIIKVFSTKENLDKWIRCAKDMDKELFGDRDFDISTNYKIKECDLDNLDFIDLLAESRSLGAQVKPIKPQ